MTFDEIRSMPHLSASQISTYIDCGLQYKFARVDKLAPEFTPDALEFGISVHRALAQFYLAKKSGKYMPITELQNSFERYWIEAACDNVHIKYKDEKDFETLLKDGKELLSVYLASLPETKYKVIAVEEPLVFELSGVIVPVIGIIDLIEEDQDGTIIITDHKTAGKSFNFDDIEKNMQLTLYKIGLQQNGYADREVLLKFDVMVKTKVPKFEQYYTTRSEEDETKLIKKIQHVYHGITSNVFLPCQDAWRCKGCQFSKACDKYLKS